MRHDASSSSSNRCIKFIRVSLNIESYAHIHNLCTNAWCWLLNVCANKFQLFHLATHQIMLTTFVSSCLRWWTVCTKYIHTTHTHAHTHCINSRTALQSINNNQLSSKWAWESEIKFQNIEQYARSPALSARFTLLSLLSSVWLMTNMIKFNFKRVALSLYLHLHLFLKFVMVSRENFDSKRPNQ